MFVNQGKIIKRELKKIYRKYRIRNIEIKNYIFVVQILIFIKRQFPNAFLSGLKFQFVKLLFPI